MHFIISQRKQKWAPLYWNSGLQTSMMDAVRNADGVRIIPDTLCLNNAYISLKLVEVLLTSTKAHLKKKSRQCIQYISVYAHHFSTADFRYVDCWSCKWGRTFCFRNSKQWSDSYGIVQSLCKGARHVHPIKVVVCLLDTKFRSRNVSESQRKLYFRPNCLFYK